MELVNRTFLKILTSWNLDVDLPENLRVGFTYDMLAGLLNRETIISDDKFVGFDFCTGYAPGCELKEYYPCLEIRNNYDPEDYNVDNNSDDLPF